MLQKLISLEYKNIFWLYFLRKICRINKIYFIPSGKKNLPKNTYPSRLPEKFFNNQYSQYLNGNRRFNFEVFFKLKKYFRKNHRINFLDFGGENLDLYLFLKEKFPKINIIIVNQYLISKDLNKIIKNKKIDFIKSYHSINLIKNEKFDFVNFGSSLQYLNDCEKILKILFKKSKKFFYISATSFYFKKNFKSKIVVKQVNLLPSILHCYIFNFFFIKKIFEESKFKVISKSKNSFKKINFKNFNIKILHLNILFKKN